MSVNANRITVRINGKDYTLIHDETDEYVHRVAHYLNTKIIEASKIGLHQGEATPVVLSALNVTDELFKSQKNFNTLKNEIKRMMDEYEKLKKQNESLEEQLIEMSEKVDKLQKELIVKEVEFNEFKKFAQE